VFCHKDLEHRSGEKSREADMKDLLNLREKEIRALTEMKIELINLE
jgi:hypothetical protein